MASIERETTANSLTLVLNRRFHLLFEPTNQRQTSASTRPPPPEHHINSPSNSTLTQNRSIPCPCPNLSAPPLAIRTKWQLYLKRLPHHHQNLLRAAVAVLPLYLTTQISPSPSRRPRPRSAWLHTLLFATDNALLASCGLYRSCLRLPLPRNGMHRRKLRQDGTETSKARSKKGNW